MSHLHTPANAASTSSTRPADRSTNRGVSPAGHLNREEAALPTQRQAAIGKLQRVAGWVASRPDWIETHKTSALILTFWAVLTLALPGLVTPALLGALADLIARFAAR
jgi:hypothetical protein